MSQEQQPRRPQEGEEAIKYGDVFVVSGELAGEAVAPRDAAMMQSVESQVVGHTQKGGPAAVMQSGADKNVHRGLVGPGEASDVAASQGFSVSEIETPGTCIVKEFVGGQPVGEYQGTAGPYPVIDDEKITIGEALEASAVTAGDKPVDLSDAAAIKSAESRVTGLNEMVPGGVAAAAQSAAECNVLPSSDEAKTKLSDVLQDATLKLPGDKPVTREDAERVTDAEMRNNPTSTTNHLGGVAASMSAAARLNQNM